MKRINYDSSIQLLKEYEIALASTNVENHKMLLFRSELYEMKRRESLMVTDGNSWLLANENIETIFS